MTKQEKWEKWIKTPPGLIQKPLHYIYKKLGPGSEVSKQAKHLANKGQGRAINTLARSLLKVGPK